MVSNSFLLSVFTCFSLSSPNPLPTSPYPYYLLPLQQIIKHSSQPCLSPSSLLEWSWKRSWWVGDASKPSVGRKCHSQSKSQLGFLGNSVFSTSHPSPWWLSFVCVLACLMYDPTIWNSLIFQTMDSRLAKNIAARKESGLYFKSIVVCVPRLPAIYLVLHRTTVVVVRTWKGKGSSHSWPPQSLLWK